jgi:hypothetical protein
MLRLTAIAVPLMLAACNSDMYVRDGVTDGDTFYLSQEAMFDPDPALQAWTTYSLVKSACQLEIGSKNPARASSYDCEIRARRHLLDTWSEKEAGLPGFRDDYLETLAIVDDVGHLDEYVVYYFGTADWTTPDELDMQSFREWQKRYLRNHKAKTRIVGSWNYRERVLDATRGAAR